MRIGIPAETRPGERRVAATPETVKKLCAGGNTVLVQKGAGAGAFFSDSDFAAAGAQLAETAADVYAAADMTLKVRGPEPEEIRALRSGTVLVGLLTPHRQDLMQAYAQHGLTAFAMERLPRISRAQSMDVLSSQANIGGYKAVLLAAHYYRRFFPMLMTAAGTVKAARVLVLGAGVAGLQAIATAKRLGSVVEAFDVRAAVKEQVESLGAKFVEVPAAPGDSGETAGGYAKEMSEDYQRRQAELIHQRAQAADVVITTALIPGKPAPALISEDTVKAMKLGSVIVDLAVEAGGNCPLTETDQVVERHGVTLVGFSNLPSMVAADASALYARNLLNFLGLLLDPKTGALNIPMEDEIIRGALVCHQGTIQPSGA